MDTEASDFNTPIERYACTIRGIVKLLEWFFSMLAWTVLVSKVEYSQLSTRSFTCFVFVMLWLCSLFYYLGRSCGWRKIVDREIRCEMYYTSIFTFSSFIAAICISATTCEEKEGSTMPDCFSKYEASAVFSWFAFFVCLVDLHIAYKLKTGAHWWQ